MKASLYSNAYDDSGTVADVAAILGAIKNGQWMDDIIRLRNLEDKKEREALKRTLPGVTFSGVFQPTRSLETCTEYNHVLVFDIDKLDLQKVEILMGVLKDDPHVLAAWRSPSGNGVKGLIPVTSDKDHHYDAFECVRIYFETNYATTIDPSGKDICRLCFITYDKDLHYNGAAVPMHIDYRADVRQKVYGDRTLKAGFAVTNDDRVKYDVCKMWAETRKPYAEGNRNNHVHTCACNMNRCGIHPERAAMILITDRTDMDVTEIQEIVRKVYKNNQREHNTITITEFQKEQELSKDAFDVMTPEDVLNQIENIGEMGITSFSEHVDITIGGFRRGNVYGFAGPEKSYKSTLAIQIAWMNAEAGIPALIAEGEMSLPQLLGYVVQQRTGFDVFTPGIAKKHAQEIGDSVRSIPLFRMVNLVEGTEESLLATIDAQRKILGRDIPLLVIDSLQNMARGRREDVPAAMHNSGVLKQVAKRANNGNGIAIIVVMHTDSICKPWDRQPENFIRGKLGVRRNLDACLSFSRFPTSTSFPDGDVNVYDLRKDILHLRVIDYRAKGDSINLMCQVNGDRKITYAPHLNSEEFEVRPKKQGATFNNPF